MSSPRQAAVLVLAGYTLAVTVILLSPSSTPGSTAVALVTRLLGDLGAPAAIADTARVEVALNVAIFAPWAALASIVWPAPGWRDWTAYAFVVTACVEATQAVLHPGRSATFSDVVANTLGALLGSLTLSLLRARGEPAGD